MIGARENNLRPQWAIAVTWALGVAVTSMLASCTGSRFEFDRALETQAGLEIVLAEIALFEAAFEAGAAEGEEVLTEALLPATDAAETGDTAPDETEPGDTDTGDTDTGDTDTGDTDTGDTDTGEAETGDDEPGIEPDIDAATRAEAAFASRLTPAGCATIARVDNAVTLTTSGCAGLGLSQVNGIVRFTYLRAEGTRRIDIFAARLRFNLVASRVESTATLTSDRLMRTMRVTTVGTGRDRFRREVTRNGEYVATWSIADGCATLNGVWKTTGLGRELELVVRDVVRCPNSCVASGVAERYFVTPKRILQVTITYSGGALADWIVEGESALTEEPVTGTIDVVCVDAVTVESG